MTRFAAPFVLAAITLFTVACGSEAEGTGGSGGSGAGGSGPSSSSGSSSTSSGSGCAQGDTMLDVSDAAGAGANYEKPNVTWSCTDTTFTVVSNGMPHYTFVQTTPNPLKPAQRTWTITRSPQIAAQTTAIPLLGYVGFSVNGIPFFGPNEAQMPANEAYGDPIYNGLMDACLGHTSQVEYHYHALSEKCLISSSLVAQPWTNADPDANKPSPIIGYAADGFAIHGARDCADAACSSVVEMKSGYVKIGDPTSYAWDAYQWQDHGDPTYLDECNGHTGPNGDYHYHATSGFPYILGCYRGTPQGTMGGGPMP